MLTCLYGSLILMGGLYLASSFIMGEFIDFGEGVSSAVEGVFGSIGDAIENIVGAHDSVADSGLDSDTSEGSGPSPFSGRTIAMFLVSFGAGGLIGENQGLVGAWSLVPALGVGALGGFLAWQALRLFYGAQSTTSIQDTDYIGLIGRVTLTIPAEGRGEVALNVKGQYTSITATSAKKTLITSSKQIIVVAKEGGTVIVEET